MSEAVTELVKLLNMNEGKKIRANHNLNGNRLFPFHTRNPERVKFTDNFDEIVGIIARCSLNKKAILDDFSEEHIDKIKQKLQTTVSENEIKRLFSIDFDTVRIPLLIQYIPVLKNNKTQIDESRGKKLLGRYITKLLRLDKNEKWKEFINTKFESDLYEKIYVDCLPEIEQDFNDEAEKRFVFFDQEEIVAKFNNDLEQLISNSHFSIDKLSLLISYYFFYYVNQQTYNLLNDKRKQKKMFFCYDKEKVSMSRESVSNGYKLFKDSSIDLLVNNDLLDYLNILSEKNKYQTLEEIMQDVDNYGILGRNLMEFNSLLANKLGEGYDSVLDIKKQILQLKKFIEILNPEEAKSRYRKSFDEFSGLNLIKSRGRLGYVFNLTQEFILLFVEIIIGNRSKILLNELFAEFGKRGIFFDKQTKKSIIQFFEEINILEKLSDSGDAQYVKSIL